MADEIHLWEYRVQTVGSFWSGVKANALEQLLNEWGRGWLGSDLDPHPGKYQ